MCERPADGQGHPACSVMVEGAFGRPLKQPLHGFRDGLLFIAPVVSRVDEKDSPPRSMAESHLTERKRMGIIAKWPFSRTDVLSSQYRYSHAQRCAYLPSCACASHHRFLYALCFRAGGISRFSRH